MFKNRDAIGKALQQMRQARCVTGQDLAIKLGVTQGFVSKVENGKLRPSTDYIEQFCKVLKIPAAARKDLLEMTKAFLLSFNRWGSEDNSLGELQEAVFNRQSDASKIEAYMTNLFVGFMQTEDYARALFQTYDQLRTKPMDEHEITVALKARIKQREILNNKAKKITVVLGEAALAEWLFGPTIHREQLIYARNLVRRTELDFRILPFQRTAPLQPMGSFMIFDRRLVEYEAQTMCFHFWENGEIEVYGRLFDQILSQAVAGREALKLIDHYAELAKSKATLPSVANS
jgi:transcriptional regulator with XRE-family HTH domain